MNCTPPSNEKRIGKTPGLEGSHEKLTNPSLDTFASTTSFVSKPMANDLKFVESKKELGITGVVVLKVQVCPTKQVEASSDHATSWR
jgi:hypothetical protein